MSAQRVVLRAHSKWLDDYRTIGEAWIDSYRSEGLTRLYDIRVAFIDDSRFHIVIDCVGKASEKVDISRVALEIYRVRRGIDGSKMDFEHVDAKEQAHVYHAMREHGKCLTWAFNNDMTMSDSKLRISEADATAI